MTLQLHDTATRSKRPFEPLEAGKVGIYLCGATVQSSPHIGHVRSAVNFDILRRWLERGHGYQVTFIRNVTDIDDKILHNAIHEQMPWWALAMKYERAFAEAYATLNCLPPTYEPRATGHITQMIELMQRLIDRGHAYAAGGDVYLDVRSLESYLTLSGQKLDDLEPAADAPERDKRDPRDFALWKGAKPDEPSWPTPWGAGRPGWHLECSAMAHAYLGEAFDIHGGGLDLIFPHHENEIAQSQAAGWGFARFWMHNAWVTTAGEKMSKSLGNTLSISHLTTQVRPIELRWYLGSAHYRSMIEFSPAALSDSATSFQRIQNFVDRAEELVGPVEISADVPAAFAAALDDDLAVPEAIAVIHDQVREGNSALTTGDKAAVKKALSDVRSMLNVLGCDPRDKNWNAEVDNTGVIDGLVALALEQRNQARAAKDWATADRIRDAIASAGIEIEDTASGTRWTVKRGG